MYFSSSTRSSPKLARASRRARGERFGELRRASTSRMPLPPPPADALISTG